MKTKYKIIALLLALLACCAYVGVNAQTQYLGSSTTTVINKGAIVADSILRVPLRDTVFPS